MPIILDGTNGLDSPDLNITGTGARITGDFSNATIANRVMFQTSTTNGQTSLSLIPNGTVSTSATASQVTFEDKDSIATGNGSNGAIGIIQDGPVFFSSNIRGTGTYRAMVFNTGGSESLRLSATSKAVILAGGSTSANGTGITFPATQSASSDPNTLDDYEEGTWTPTYGAQGSNPTVTYNIQAGRYIKIGKLVWFSINLSTNSFSGGSGAIVIDGWPFTLDSDTLAKRVSFATETGATWSVAAATPRGINAYTTNRAVLIYRNTTGGWGETVVSDASGSSGGVNFLQVSGCYITTS